MQNKVKEFNNKLDLIAKYGIPWIFELAITGSSSSSLETTISCDYIFNGKSYSATTSTIGIIGLSVGGGEGDNNQTTD